MKHAHVATISGAVGAIMLFAAIHAGAADKSTAWLGAPLPNLARLDPNKVYAGQLAFGALPVSTHGPLRGADIHRFVEQIVGISDTDRKTGAPMWGRVAGLAGDVAMTKYVEARFREFGLSDVHIDEIPLSPQWFPVSWKLTLLANPSYGAGTADFVFQTSYPAPARVINFPKNQEEWSASPPNPQAPQGIEAELVWAGLGEDSDLALRDVKGKIVALRQGGRAGRNVAEKVADLGAVAVVLVSDVPQSAISVVVGTGSARIPSYTVSYLEGAFLQDVILRSSKTQPVRLRAQLESKIVPGLKTHNIVGTVKGTGDEYLAVTAHHDSYFYGAIDNASGVASMLAVAQHYATSKQRPKRNLLFVATGAHHGGFAGSHYLADYYKPVLDKAVLILNSEHTSGVLTTGGAGGLAATNTELPKGVDVSPANSLITKLFGESLARYGVVVDQAVGDVPVGDALPYYNAGFPAAQIIEVSKYYHTTADILPGVTPNGLERATNAFVDFIDKLDATPRTALEAARSRAPQGTWRSGAAD